MSFSATAIPEICGTLYTIIYFLIFSHIFIHSIVYISTYILMAPKYTSAVKSLPEL
jgi:hypothetical protein